MRFIHSKKGIGPAEAREWLEHCLSHQSVNDKSRQSFQPNVNAKLEFFLACFTLSLCLLASSTIALSGLRAVEGMFQASSHMRRGYPPSSFRF